MLTGHPGNVTAVAFSADGEVLCSSGLGSEILVWSVADGRLERSLEGHEVAVGSLEVSPDGRYLISTGYEGTAKAWSTEDWKISWSVELPSTAGFLALSPDGETLAVSTDFKVLLWSTSSRGLVEELPVPAKGVYQLDFSPDGRWLAVAAADKRVRVWELPRNA